MERLPFGGPFLALLCRADARSLTEAAMKVLGQYDTSGDYRAYTEPQEVFPFGHTLRDGDGFVVAVKDSYGDWVSPTLHKMGIKSKIEVET